jgi:hypothetical protein
MLHRFRLRLSSAALATNTPDGVHGRLGTEREARARGKW